MSLTFSVISYKGAPPPAALSGTIDQGGGSLGRAPDNQFVLPDPEKFVSRKHASIGWHDGQFLYTDASSGGTYFVNRDLLLQHDTLALADGEILRVGEYEIAVRIESVQPQPASPFGPGPFAAELAPVPAGPEAAPEIPPFWDTKPPEPSPAMFDPFQRPAPEPLRPDGLLFAAPPPAGPSFVDQPDVSAFHENFAPPEIAANGANPAPTLADFDAAELLKGLDWDSDAGSAGGTDTWEPPEDMFKGWDDPPAQAEAPLSDPFASIAERPEIPMAKLPTESITPIEPGLPIPEPVVKAAEAAPPVSDFPFEPLVTAVPADPVQPAPQFAPELPMLAETAAVPAVPSAFPDVSLPADSATRLNPMPVDSATRMIPSPAPAEPPSVPPAAVPVQAAGPVPPERPTHPTVPIPPAQSAAPRPEPVATPAPAANPIATAPTSPVPAAALQSNQALLAAFLQGAGLENAEWIKNEDPANLMGVAGMLLKDFVDGMITVLRVRAEIKSQMRVSVTTMRALSNNPLKFTVTAQDALKVMLARGHPGFMEPVEAIRNGFSDLMNHQLAIAAGTQAALSAGLKQFDPQRLESQVPDSLLGQKKARCWDAYVKAYPRLVEDVVENFFGDEFSETYERQMRNSNSPKTS